MNENSDDSYDEMETSLRSNFSEYTQDETEFDGKTRSESLRTSVRLRLNASSLPHRGIRKIWAPDTFAVVVTPDGTKFETETVECTRHPQYATPIIVNFEYGSQFLLTVTVFDASTRKPFGVAYMELSDLLGTRHRSKVKRFGRGGCVCCRAEIVSDSEIVRFQIGADLSTKNKVNPFLEIAYKTEHHFLVVYRSNTLQGTSKPRWDPGEMDLGTLCGGNLNQVISFTVKHKHRRIGSAESTMKHILDNPGLELRLHKKEGVVGLLTFSEAKILGAEGANEALSDLSALSPVTAPVAERFRQLVDEGLSMDLCVAIDFTSSNKDPRKPESLHYLSGESLNDYEDAITSVCNGLEQYKMDEYIVWGFGAKFGGVLRHLFQCGDLPTVDGVNGVISAYRSVFSQGLVMSEPTVITKVINAAGVRAKKCKDAGTRKHTILLIITDGIMEDIEETKQKLELCEQVPLSVVIVCVGRVDFSTLRSLGDSPITTVCEYRVHQHDPAALGLAALGNIPLQVCRYFR